MTCPEAPNFQAHPPKGSLPAIIFNLAAALLPFIGAIHNDDAQPWTRRTRAATRVNRILFRLLALVARMHPRKLGAAAFTKLRTSGAQAAPRPATPPASNPAPAPPHAKPPRHWRTPRRPLSARQVAASVALLLRELETAAHEAGHPLPPHIQDLCAELRTAAGCQALRPNPQTPVSALESTPNTATTLTPPGYPLRL